MFMLFVARKWQKFGYRLLNSNIITVITNVR